MAVTSVVVVGLTTSFLARQTRDALSIGFNELQEKKLENVYQILGSMLELQVIELDSILRTVRSDNELSGSFILAVESNDLGVVDRNLQKLKQDADLSFVEVLDLNGKPLNQENHSVINRFKEHFLSLEEDHSGVVRRGDNPLVLKSGRLTHYGEAVGTLILGKEVSSDSVKRVMEGLAAKVAFHSGRFQADIPGQTSMTLVQVPSAIAGDPIYAKVELIEEDSRALGNLLTTRLYFIGISSLIILLVLFYLVLEFGFVHEFKSLVNSIKSYGRGLKKGEQTRWALPESRIREVQQVSHAFHELGESIREYQKQLKAKTKSEMEAKKEAALAQLARQVAHDIRSPLAALSAVASLGSGVPEETRNILRSVADRIRDITNNLISRNKPSSHLQEDSLRSEFLAPLIESLLSEKREQYRTTMGLGIRSDLQVSAYRIFAIVNKGKLKRVLSNLIDNAVDAMDSEGEVRVEIESISENKFEILIKDSGQGIPESELEKVFEKGHSLKKNGCGLGLYSARQEVRKWGGEICLESQVGVGTTVRIRLSSAKPPVWFCEEISLYEGIRVVVVDDDPSVHEIWSDKLNKVQLNRLEVIHFSRLLDFKDFIRKDEQSCKSHVFLVDYEFLNEKENGLEVIRGLSLVNDSILITSHFEDQKVLNESSRIGLKMIPKSIVGLVPLVVASPPALGLMRGEKLKKNQDSKSL